MSPFFRRLLLATLLGVVVYGCFVAYAGVSQIAQSLTHFKPGAFLLALLLACGNYLLRFAKWEYYLARLGVTGVAKGESLLIFLSGFVLTVTPGKLGEVFKSALLKQTHDVPISRTAPIIFAERLTDVVGVVILILVGTAAFPAGRPWALAGTSAVGAGLLLIMWQTPLRLLIERFERSRWSRLGPRLREAHASLRIVAGPGALLLPTALSVVGWGAEGIALFLILDGFGASVALEHAVLFYAAATLAGALVPVPGGLGVAEALIQEQLVRVAGVVLQIATASMLLVRLATLWWAVLVGFMALFLLRLRYPSLLMTHRPAPLEIHPPSPPSNSLPADKTP